mmetsp:Transcript_4321/g.12614  ORF Transcript_4321/g.12614 Transcript_4321/m.12614 type:complete len:581 (+) Transcript_4321:133-1875(+)
MKDARDFQILNGDLAAAFEVQEITPATARPFTPVDVFFAEGTEIGETVEIAKPPETIPGVFVALYGADSTFRQQIPKAAEAVVTPVQPVNGAPWCGTGTVNMPWDVPVLGKSDYKEEVRVALCRATGKLCLAVQAALTIAVGFPVGDVLLEVLYTFTQASMNDPILFQAKCIIPPSTFYFMMLRSLVEAYNDYVATARRLLQATDLSLLHLELPICEGLKELDVNSNEDPTRGFKVCEGTIVAALQAQQSTPETHRPFIHPDIVMRGGSKQLADIEVAQPPATIFGLFLALYGPSSRFRQQIQGAENAKTVRPVQPIEAAPWCGVGVVTLAGSLPVAGKTEYVEEVRTGLSTSEGGWFLATQAACTVRMRFPFGESLMEALYVFSQASMADPIIFSAYGTAQPGRANDMLMQSLLKGAELYVEALAKFLSTVPPELLSLQPPEAVRPPVELEPPQGTEPVAMAVQEEESWDATPGEDRIQWMWADSALVPLPGVHHLARLNPLRWSSLRPALALAAELALQGSDRGVLLRSAAGSVRTFPDAHTASRWIHENLSPQAVGLPEYGVAMMALGETILKLRGG